MNQLRSGSVLGGLSTINFAREQTITAVVSSSVGVINAGSLPGKSVFKLNLLQPDKHPNVDVGGSAKEEKISIRLWTLMGASRGNWAGFIRNACLGLDNCLEADNVAVSILQAGVNTCQTSLCVIYAPDSGTCALLFLC